MDRTVALHPMPDARFACPHCRGMLNAKGWLITGMRNLAELECAKCAVEYFGDLSAGQAVYTPVLLEKVGGAIHDRHAVGWFADWLASSYARRTTADVAVTVIEAIPVRGAVTILNCLDVLFGHSLLKLLNAQYHLDQSGDVSLIVIVPSWLVWMVPAGVAQLWVVELPLTRGLEWNDGLAANLATLVARFPQARLSQALSHPRESEFDIERFTRTKPFNLSTWDAKIGTATIAFIWRDDRVWNADTDVNGGSRQAAVSAQQAAVIRLAQSLREGLPGVQLVVAGAGPREPKFPDWIDDVRSPDLTADRERTLCQIYARCHLVIGVHGSNMLLPSAHAGSVIELAGPDRMGNFAQDILFRDTGDHKDLLFRYRFLDVRTSAETVADLALLIVRKRSAFLHLMNVLPR